MDAEKIYQELNSKPGKIVVGPGYPDRVSALAIYLTGCLNRIAEKSQGVEPKFKDAIMRDLLSIAEITARAETLLDEAKGAEK